MATPSIISWRFDVPLAREALWRVVADSNQLNCIAGLFPIRYSYRPGSHGESEVHGEARTAGMVFRWIERPCEWVAPEYYRVVRDYYAGPFARLVTQVTLERVASKRTRLIHHNEVTPRGLLGPLAVRFGFRRGFGRGLARAVASAPQWSAGRPGRLAPLSRTRADAAGELRRRLAAVAKRFECEPVVERLAEFISDQPQSELSSLAPYVLASRWGLDRKRVLRLMLHAARAGALDMEYNLICPSCRRSKAVFRHLSAVGTQGHCPSCNIGFAVDFDRAVEVRFSPRPLGVCAQVADYCHSGPRNTPHRLAAWRVAAGERREMEVPINEAGTYQLNCPDCAGAVYFEVVGQGEVTAGIGLRLDPAGIAGMPPRVGLGSIRLTAASLLETETTLRVSRTAWADDAASAAEVTSMPEFRDLFGSQVLAPGAEFAIRSLTFLFSDLVDSTAMYSREGDAQAFALVRDHFELLRETYTHHGGALVKTIGDSVMVVFSRADEALAAALEIHRVVGRLREGSGTPLRLRIGLHAGPAIAVEANGQLDYFGTTVNLAARVQGAAGGCEIALTAQLCSDPAVARLLEGLPVRRVKADLKGLRGQRELVVVSAIGSRAADGVGAG